MRTCKDCALARAAQRPPPKQRDSRLRTPCRHCLQLLDRTHYKHELSWYCYTCVTNRKEAARLQLPPAPCDTCGAVTQRANMLKTKTRCTACETQLRAQAKAQQYANHTYSTSTQARRKRRYRSDPLYRLKDNVSTLIANSFANRGYSKHSRTQQILGCSYQDFCTHIESQFAVGMAWNNRHLWHLDHRVPISLAENEQELKLLNHYTNFQPLWSGENQTKSARVDSEDLLYQKLLAARAS